MRVKVPSKLTILLSIAVATCWFIFNVGTPYIRTYGNSLVLETTPFDEFIINFRDDFQITRYLVSRFETVDTYYSSEVKISNKTTTNLVIKNPFFINKNVNNSDFYKIKIESKIPTGFEIISATIDGKKIDLKIFLEKNLNNQGEYIYFRYIQKELAEIIFRSNEWVSNWVLTVLFFSTVFLIVKLLIIEVRVYLYSENYFFKYLQSFLKIKDDSAQSYEDAWDKYVANWYRWDCWLTYFQAIGPALGFILTVTSLIQALHPIVGASNNIDEFLKAIHIAMVSTFLGLFLRIVSLEGARINNVSLNRTEILFDNKLSQLTLKDSHKKEIEK